MEQTPNMLIERFLDHIINPYDCVDIYGRSYIDDLENILLENHAFDFGTQKFPDEMTQKWFERTRQALGVTAMEQLIAHIRANASSISIANIRPRNDLHLESLTEWVPEFETLKPDGDFGERHNEAQRIFSIPSVKELHTIENDADRYELYLGTDRLNPWTYLVRREIRRGNIPRDDRAICIGNRWTGEILYFRENLGLKKTMGLDLFTSNPEIVMVGDMHKMPFEDNSIKLIFIRQALSKSYDVRLVVKEILRVLKKDGFFIVEIPGPYGWGVGRMRGSDVKSARSLIRLFRGKVSRIVYTDEMEVYRAAYAADVQRVIRVFAQVNKDGRVEKPVEEKVSLDGLKAYVRRRERMLRTKDFIRRLPRAPRKLWRTLTGQDGKHRQ